MPPASRVRLLSVLSWLRRLAGPVLFIAIAIWIGQKAFFVLEGPVTRQSLRADDTPRSLPIPVEGVTMRRVVDARESGNSADQGAYGVNIYAGRGTPVRAATDGVLSFVMFNEKLGNGLMLSGPGGMSIHYSRMDAFADIRNNQVVKAGDLLGYVGNTGLNAGDDEPHLHLQVYVEGKAVDPYPLLRGGGR